MFDHWSLAESLKQKGVPFVLATVVRAESPTSAKAGDKAIVTAEGVVGGWVGGSCAEPTVLKEAKAALIDGECRLIHLSPVEDLPPSRQGLTFVPMTCYSGGTLEIYIEPYRVAPTLLVYGNSPVAEALAHLGQVMKYRVTVVDLTKRPPMPGDFTTYRTLDDLPAPGGGPLYAVVATHGNFDERAVRHAIGLNPTYLGLVASKRRAGELRNDLRSEGVDAAALARLHAPAGLPLGAEGPEEIALSIMSQIVRQARRSSEVPRLEAILLAAGESRRMGRNKLLLPVDGVPLVRRTAETLLAGGFEKVIVVLGFEAELVRAALAGLKVEFVVNERYTEGQPTSVRAGLTAISSEASGVMIALSDQPHLTPADVREITEAFHRRSGGSVLVPTFGGQRGNPIILDRGGLDTILARDANFGCRQFTTKHADLVVLHPMSTDHVVKDLDLPEEYAELTQAETRA